MSKDNPIAIKVALVCASVLFLLSVLDVRRVANINKELVAANATLAYDSQLAQMRLDSARYELACSRAHHDYRISDAGQCQYPVPLGNVTVWANDDKVGKGPQPKPGATRQ